MAVARSFCWGSLLVVFGLFATLLAVTSFNIGVRRTGSSLLERSVALWPTFHHDLNRTGYQPEGFGLVQHPRVKWAFNTSDAVPASPAIFDIDGDDDPEVLIGSRTGVFYCLSGADGSVEWSFATGGGIRSGATIEDVNNDGLLEVIFGSDDYGVYCLSYRGELIWSFTTSGKVGCSPAVVDIDQDGAIEVLIGSYDENLYCLDGATGRVKWTFLTGGYVFSSPAVADLDSDGDLEVVFGSVQDYTVWCLSGKDGSLEWSFSASYTIWATPTIADVDQDGVLEVMIGSTDCRLYCLSGDTGEREWVYAAYDYASTPGVADVDGDGEIEVVFGSFDNNVYCVSADKNGDGRGELEWVFETEGSASSAPAFADLDHDGVIEVVAASRDGGIYCLSGINGSLEWCYKTGAQVRSSPSIADVDCDGFLEVLCGSYDDCVYCIEEPEDVEPPTVHIISPPNATWLSKNEVTVSWEAFDDLGIRRYRVLLNGTEVASLPSDESNCTVSLPEQGQYNVTVVAEDFFGKVGSDTIWVYADLTPPSVNILVPTNGSASPSPILLQWNASDLFGVLSQVWVFCNQSLAAVLPPTTYEYNLTCEEGWVSIRVVVFDMANNTGDDTVLVLVDQTPPYIRITYPENGSQIDQPQVNVSWTASDNFRIDHFEVRLDTGPLQDVGNATSAVFTDLSYGSHRVTVFAFDTAGNSANSTVTFFVTVDIYPPSIRIVSPANATPLNTPNATVRWVADDDAGIKHFLVYVDSNLEATLSSTTRKYLVGGLSDGWHTVQVYAVDIGGNNASDVVFLLVDTAPPVIRILAPENGSLIEGDSVTVRWEVYDETSGISCVLLRIDNRSWIEVTDTLNYTFTNLAPGIHTVELAVTDLAGNTKFSHVTFSIVEARTPILEALGKMGPLVLIVGVLAAGAVAAIVLLLVKRRRKPAGELATT